MYHNNVAQRGVVLAAGVFWTFCLIAETFPYDILAPGCA
jgi:hypothetical protein